MSITVLSHSHDNLRALLHHFSLLDDQIHLTVVCCLLSVVCCQSNMTSCFSILITTVKTTYLFSFNVNTHMHSKETWICDDWPPKHRSHSPGCPPGPGGWGWGWPGGLWGHTISTPAWRRACSPGGSLGSGPSPTEDRWPSRRPGGLDRDH